MSNQFKVTDIRFSDRTREVLINEDGDTEEVRSYSADIVINNLFIVQISGNDDEANFEGVCDSRMTYWNDESEQKKAEKYDDSEIERQIEIDGFENNFDFLNENATLS
ncbi:MAG: hypothetical protein JKY48_04865 [Flavobacteriales bacterium]|nr:hypothetical protein [Flavobacteriales bacterium]